MEDRRTRMRAVRTVASNKLLLLLFTGELMDDGSQLRNGGWVSGGMKQQCLQLVTQALLLQLRSCPRGGLSCTVESSVTTHCL